MRLLLVEDDAQLASALVNSLAQSGYLVDAVHAGHEALTTCLGTPFQLVILDLGLPDMDGVELLRRLRRQGLTSPILILTARDDLRDRIHGLDAGADDYLSKPFAIGELEARIRALLRRGQSSSATVRFGNLDFDLNGRQATVSGHPIELTSRELAVLELLMQKPGRVVSKSQLIGTIYEDPRGPSMAVIEVFVSRLRKKLVEADTGVSIRVLRGLGYRLEVGSDGK